MTKANGNGNGNDVDLLDLDSPELRRALAVWTNAQLISRSMLANRLGTQFNGARDLYKTFGYPQEPGYQDFRNLYDRQGMATRAVEKFADDTWNKPPVIIDGNGRSDNLSENATPFLKEWVALNKRLSVIQILRQADIMLGFSRYSVVFMGAPGTDFSQPAENDGLFYLMAFDESQATIGEYIDDTKSEKFAMPKNYSISFNSVDAGAPMPGGNQVHYSRVIHASENKLGSRLYGRPRLKNLINRLYDLEKVVGGGAEAAWLAVYKGILFSAREGAEIPATGSPEASRLDEQMNALMHRIQRYAVVSDVDVHDLGVESVSISDIFGVVVSDASATLGIPQRIWLGSERGELASSQDKDEWNGVIRSRRTHHAEPELLFPFINWCVIHKVIPPPSSGEFSAEWEDVYPMSKAEKATYGASLATGANTVTGGVPDEAMDVEEWRAASGLPPRTKAQLAEIEEKAKEREEDERQAKQDELDAMGAGLGKMDNAKQKGFSANVQEFGIMNALGKLFSIVRQNSFDGHAGRPGQRGGSLPRGETAEAAKKKAEEVSRGVIDQLRSGGFSQSIEGVSPSGGFMTATSTKTEKKIAIADVNDEAIQNYVLENYAELQKPDAYLGGWLDTDEATGEVHAYLDVSTNFQSLSDTVDIASQSNQIGVYDIGNGRTVYIDYDNNKSPFYWKDEKKKTGKTYIQ